MSEQDWSKKSNSPLAWDPEEQKEIVGVLLSVQHDVGKFKTTLATLELLDGTERAVWCNKMLKDLVSKVKLGNEVKIVFTGLKEAKSGTGEFKTYEVYDRPAPLKKVEASEEPKF